MIGIVKLVAVIFFMLSLQLGLMSQSSVAFVKFELDTDKTKYSWSSEITQLAIEAINQSISNLKLPKKERPKNFPSSPGPYNVHFTQDKIVNYEIIGYSFTEDDPDIYDIEFRPKNDRCKGVRVIVKVSINSEKAIMVYMQADS